MLATFRLSVRLVLLLAFSCIAPHLHAADDFCWKNTYPRGAGTVPKSDCPPGQENDAGLCYPVCKQYYKGVGPVCWAKDYGNGTGYPWKFKDGLKHPDRGMEERCKADHKQGCFKYGAMYYPNCSEGFHHVGGNICQPDGKLSYTRGVGQLYCKSNEEKDAGLCYADCKAGYYGVGPVCWGNCPKGYVSCGAGCATSSKACALDTLNQVTSALNLAVSIATFGMGGEAEAGAEAAENASKFQQLKAQAKEAWATFKETAAFRRMEAAKQAGQSVSAIYNFEQLMTGNDKAIVNFDPTGFSQTVMAYAHAKCE